jgi:hypothetical protein
MVGRGTEVIISLLLMECIDRCGGACADGGDETKELLGGVEDGRDENSTFWFGDTGKGNGDDDDDDDDDAGIGR